MYAISCSMSIYRKAGIQNKEAGTLWVGIILMLTAVQAFGQDSIVPPAARSHGEITSTAVIDFFTTFAGMHVINGQTSNENNSVYLYYNFSVNNKLKAGKLVMLNYYNSELGIRKYFDSITTISDDQYLLKNSVSCRIAGTGLAINLGMIAKSQYFNHYDYKPDSMGKMERYLFSSYSSPGYTNFSGGIKFEFDDNCAIELGLVNGRKTRIRNQTLFETRGVDKLYGLSKGNIRKMDFGFNMIVSIPTHCIAKNFYIENFSQINVNKNSVFDFKDYIFDINNAFHYKLFKYFRLTLRTKLLYDITINARPKIINQITAGFYLNNMF